MEEIIRSLADCLESIAATLALKITRDIDFSMSIDGARYREMMIGCRGASEALRAGIVRAARVA